MEPAALSLFMSRVDQSHITSAAGVYSLKTVICSDSYVLVAGIGLYGIGWVGCEPSRQRMYAWWQSPLPGRGGKPQPV